MLLPRTTSLQILSSVDKSDLLISHLNNSHRDELALATENGMTILHLLIMHPDRNRNLYIEFLLASCIKREIPSLFYMIDGVTILTFAENWKRFDLAKKLQLAIFEYSNKLLRDNQIQKATDFLKNSVPAHIICQFYQQIPRFTINTIAYVPVDIKNEDDSSDETLDDDFKRHKIDFDFNCANAYQLPFRTLKIRDQQDIIDVNDNSAPLGKVDRHQQLISYQDEFLCRLFCLNEICIKIMMGRVNLIHTIFSLDSSISKTLFRFFFSTYGEPSQFSNFMSLLEKGGFEPEDIDKLSTINVCYGMNRPRSLSDRINRIFEKEVRKPLYSKIKFYKFGFYWDYNWFTSSNSPVNYNTVRKFYKQLKRFNRKKAEQFRSLWENEVNTRVPYQALRDYVHNQIGSQQLVAGHRSLNCDVFLSLIDSDTLDFNGIFSAYNRIYSTFLQENSFSPTVMSTGYEFRGNLDEYPYQFGSKLDRSIRVETAKFLPFGVYYPEPNTCILFENTDCLLKEKFVDEASDKELFKLGNSESTILLRQVRKRSNARFLFSNDNPLMTTIPARTKKNKQGGLRQFSISFTRQQDPTPANSDKSTLKYNQSHYDEDVWAKNLYKLQVYQSPIWIKSFVGPLKNYLTSSPVDKSKLLQDIQLLFNGSSVNVIDFQALSSAIWAVKEIINFHFQHRGFSTAALGKLLLEEEKNRGK